MESGFDHKSVLLNEVVSFILPRDNCTYVDATVGSGGHAEKILEKSGPRGRLIGLDFDPSVLEIAKGKLEKFNDRCSLVESNYTEVVKVVKSLGVDKIDGIIFDLGVNLEHFVNPERGFSFMKDGPLDMRLSPKIKVTAADIINKWEEKDLIDILFKFGEERYARKIIGFVVEARRRKKISTTAELSEIIISALGKGKIGRIHPATKTFQALRIAVNNELFNLEYVLPQAIDILNPGGRICVISFHSLEDKIVKSMFRSLAQGCLCPPEVNVCMCGNKPKIKLITKKPIVPGEEEIFVNPRSRSAKLRVAEKL